MTPTNIKDTILWACQVHDEELELVNKVAKQQNQRVLEMMKNSDANDEQSDKVTEAMVWTTVKRVDLREDDPHLSRLVKSFCQRWGIGKYNSGKPSLHLEPSDQRMQAYRNWVLEAGEKQGVEPKLTGHNRISVTADKNPFGRLARRPLRRRMGTVLTASQPPAKVHSVIVI